VRVKVVKNKVAPPFKQAEFDIYFNEGISRVGEIIDLGLEKKILERAGAWYSYDGTRIGQGRENTRQYLKANPEMMQDIESKILEAYNFKR
jgi:recombination protein RecA